MRRTKPELHTETCNIRASLFSVCSGSRIIDRNPLLVKYSYMRRSLFRYSYQLHCVDKNGDVIETIGEMNIWTVAFAAFNAAARSI